MNTLTSATNKTWQLVNRTIMMASTLALVGCGASEPTNEATPSRALQEKAGSGVDLDPCSLLTADDIKSITTDEMTRINRAAGNCHYQGAANVSLLVTAYATGGQERMETGRRAAKVLDSMGSAAADKGGAGANVKNMLQPANEKPPALGDEAVWGMNDTLLVRKGDAFIEVTPPMMHDPSTHTGIPLISSEEKRAIAVAVVTKALSKLP
jgi:hypothetical protein